MSIVLFVAGLGLLILGAEWLVRGASRLAVALGLSPLVIGLTVVAYGTSAPELAVGVKAAWAGQADIAVGNVVGSNIFNVLLVLGLSAVVAPLAVSSQLTRLEVPIMIGVSVLAVVLAADGSIGRFDGAVLTACAIAYTVFQVRQSRRVSPADAALAATTPSSVASGTPAAAKSPLVLNLALIVTGLVMLVMGSRWLVAAAVTFAQAMGVSELVTGLTIVAAGTSLPEVATSVMAASRGQRDIAVGNVVGSNILNLAVVLGVAGLVAPAGIPTPAALLHFDMPVMLAVAVACLPIFASGGEIARWEGALFLFHYLAYTTYLVLAAQQHDALPLFSAAMVVFVLPLTAITLVVITWRTWTRARASSSR